MRFYFIALVALGLAGCGEKDKSEKTGSAPGSGGALRADAPTVAASGDGVPAKKTSKDIGNTKSGDKYEDKTKNPNKQAKGAKEPKKPDDDKPKVTGNIPKGWDLILPFAQQVNACESLLGAVSRVAMKCELGASVELEGIGSVTIDKKVYELTQIYSSFSVKAHDILINVMDETNKANYCAEQVGLKLLDGLSGFVPKTIPITGGVDAPCRAKIIAIENKGDADWADAVEHYDAAFYVRAVRLLEAVKAFHDKGFNHGMISGYTVRVAKSDPSVVVLTNLRTMIPLMFVHTGEMDSGSFTRKMDMLDVVETMRLLAQAEPGWLTEMRNEIEGLGASDRPDYEKWISRMKQEGKSV